MTNKFISMVDGNRQGVASDLGTRFHRSDSLSVVSRQSVFSILLLCLTLFVGVGNVWGADVVVTLDNIGSGLGSTANTTAATTDITATGTTDSYTLNYYQCKKQGNSMLMTKSVNPYISNKTAMPGNIKSVEVFINSGASGKTTYDCAFSTTECTSETSGIGAVNIIGGNSHTYSNLTNKAINVKGKYFCVTLGNAYNGQVLKLVITCEGSTNSDPVAVTGVTLDESTITLDPGDTQLLTATVAPGDATNKTVSWTSSNTSVATVDAGLVTAVAAGEATITATTQDGSFTDECTVTVTDITKSSLNFTAACGGSGTADDGAEWEVTSDAAESNFDSSRGIHYGTTSSATVQYVKLTTSDISGTITKVVVNASDATGTADISVSVGGTDFTCSGSTTVTNSNPGSNYTFTGSASGEIIVLVDRGSAAYKAIYVKSVIVTYEPCNELASINGSFLRYHFLDHFGPFWTNQQISVYFS